MAITHAVIQSALIQQLDEAKTIKHSHKLITFYLTNCQLYEKSAKEFANAGKSENFLALINSALTSQNLKAVLFLIYEYSERFKSTKSTELFDMMRSIDVNDVWKLQAYQLMHHIVSYDNFTKEDTLKLIDALSNYINLYENFTCKLGNQATLCTAAKIALYHNKNDIFERIANNFGAFFLEIPQGVVVKLENLLFLEIITKDDKQYFVPAYAKIAESVEQAIQKNRHCGASKHKILEEQKDFLLKFEQAMQDAFNSRIEEHNQNAPLYPWYATGGILLSISQGAADNEKLINTFITLLKLASSKTNDLLLMSGNKEEGEAFYNDAVNLRQGELDILISLIKRMNKKIDDVIGCYDQDKNTLTIPGGDTRDAIHVTAVLALFPELILPGMSWLLTGFSWLSRQGLPGINVVISLAVCKWLLITSVIITIASILSCLIMAMLLIYAEMSYDKALLLQFPANTLTMLLANDNDLRIVLDKYFKDMDIQYSIDTTAKVMSKDYLNELKIEYQAIERHLTQLDLKTEFKNAPEKMNITAPNNKVSELINSIPGLPEVEVEEMIVVENKQSGILNFLKFNFLKNEQKDPEVTKRLLPAKDVIININDNDIDFSNEKNSYDTFLPQMEYLKHND